MPSEAVRTRASSPSSPPRASCPFTTAPDFENPADVGANNEYVVAVRATSGAGGRAKTATQTILVTVTDVVEGPALSPHDVDDSGGD